jgi:hypothetical protein
MLWVLLIAFHKTTCLAAAQHHQYKKWTLRLLTLILYDRKGVNFGGTLVHGHKAA